MARIDMAEIDKTYIKTWEEYESLVEWAKDREFICPNGMKVYPMNYIYKCNKEDYEKSYNSFKENYPNEKFEFPVMNTPQYLDYFLIKYCPLEFVQNRMEEVYGWDYVKSVLNGTCEFDTYKRDIGTKVKVIKYPLFSRNKNKLCEKKKQMKFIYLREKIDDYYLNLWYNEDYNCWVSLNELGYYTSNMCHKNINSVKAMIRQIKKWKLPKGTVVDLAGRYVNNVFSFLVY